MDKNRISFESYLIDVGFRVHDTLTNVDDELREKLKQNIEYFRRCYENELSAYKALLFFEDYLNGNYII